MNREQSIHQYASTLGFDRCGIARCRPLEERRDQLQQWLDQGHHGGLTYMERNLDKRLDPTLLVEGARSIIVCAISYKRPPAQGLITRFASYAWGRDYHSVLKEKLRALFAHIQELIPNTTGRLFVDTAPILEKSWAAEAGVGRIGRNSLLIVPGIGSFVVLGLIVTNAELEPDPPLSPIDPCGSCRACVEACPVGAIGPNRTIDASRCIARRTIEAEPDNEEELYGWIFGCDTCQQVCPHNRHAPVSPHTCFAPTPGLAEMTANDWLQLTDEEFKHRFRDTPLLRCGLQRIQRRIHELQDIANPLHSIPSK